MRENLNLAYKVNSQVNLEQVDAKIHPQEDKWDKEGESINANEHEEGVDKWRNVFRSSGKEVKVITSNIS